MIRTEKLTKSFKSYKKKPGFMGSIESLYKRDYSSSKTTTRDYNSFSRNIPKTSTTVSNHMVSLARKQCSKNRCCNRGTKKALLGNVKRSI